MAEHRQYTADLAVRDARIAELESACERLRQALLKIADIANNARSFGRDVGGDMARVARTALVTRVAQSDPARIWEGVVSQDETELDEGVRDNAIGARTHTWGDASCWLHGLRGRRARVTVEDLGEAAHSAATDRCERCKCAPEYVCSCTCHVARLPDVLTVTR